MERGTSWLPPYVVGVEAIVVITEPSSGGTIPTFRAAGQGVAATKPSLHGAALQMLISLG